MQISALGDDDNHSERLRYALYIGNVVSFKTLVCDATNPRVTIYNHNSSIIQKRHGGGYCAAQCSPVMRDVIYFVRHTVVVRYYANEVGEC